MSHFRRPSLREETPNVKQYWRGVLIRLGLLVGMLGFLFYLLWLAGETG